MLYTDILQIKNGALCDEWMYCQYMCFGFV